MQIVGYARTPLDLDNFRQRIVEKVKLRSGAETPVSPARGAPNATSAPNGAVAAGALGSATASAPATAPAPPPPALHPLIKEFQERCHYVSGSYEDPASFVGLKEKLVAVEREMLERRPAGAVLTRIYYLALPPAMFHPVAQNIKSVLHDPAKAQRLIVEKPFGRDLESSNELSRKLGALFPEEQVGLDGGGRGREGGMGGGGVFFPWL